MSRIVGLQSSAGSEERRRWLDSMLAASRGSTSWHSRSAGASDVLLGWCGWSAPNVASVDGVIAVMDGCLYNRDELGPSTTDAELLATLYVRHGFAAALGKLNGDFAVAIYDPRDATIWLGRDRFGLKPLYYLSEPDRFAFASRPAALLALQGVSREIDREFVALYAATHYRYVDNTTDASPYEGIKQLPAAHLLRVTNGQTATEAYWSLVDGTNATEIDPDPAERYRELLLDSVSRRLKVARRPTFTLSGGMDSSSVLACAVSLTGARQTAFSTVYDDKTYDETDAIKTMLDTQVQTWTPVHVATPDVFGLVRRMVALHDQPVATATWLSHLLLCERIAAAGFESVFGGLGGDELNAGEYEFFRYFFADLRVAGETERLAREIDRWIALHDHPVFPKSGAMVEQGFRTIVDLAHPGRNLPDRERLGRYAVTLNPDYFELHGFEPVMESPFDSYLKNRMYQDMTRETVTCSARAEDRQSVACGLDNFVPFFDHRLAEFVFAVPAVQHIADGVTKQVLRSAMRGILPETTRTRTKKTGWNAPAHVWFSGAGRGQLLDLVQSRRFRERGIYNVGEVVRLIDEHDRIVSSGEPRDNHMMFLWQLVNLEFWLEWIDEL